MVRVAILLVAAAGFAQPQPLRCVAEVGSLSGAVRDLGVAMASEERPGVLRLDGRDRAGRPWRAWTEVQGGVGWTTAWLSDFDRDGHDDLLLARLSLGVGRCPASVQTLVLTFDPQGRPVPFFFESLLPADAATSGYPVPVTTRRLRDGTVEFLVRGCHGGTRWLRAGARPAQASGHLEELRSAEFGGRAMDSPGQRMLISGQWHHVWPARVVVDAAAGRDVYLADPWPGLRRALAERLKVRFDGEELWAEGKPGAKTG